jgi:predicted exporter
MRRLGTLLWLVAVLLAGGYLARVGEGIDADRLKRLGSLYFPYRQGLLSEGDRASLAAGRGEDIAMRALSQAFGFAGPVDAGLLRTDPFLLLPSFFTNLPFPLSRLPPDDGMLSVTEDGVTWVLVSATLAGEPFELDLQERLVAAFDASVGAAPPGLQVKRLGAVFFAHAGSQTAIREASTLSTLSLVGTMLLVVLVFRRLAPLLHNVLALGVGMGVGLSGSLMLFGELHVAALLFGTSLTGVAVDYGLHYSACWFDLATPTARPCAAGHRAGAGHHADRLRGADAGAIFGAAADRGVLDHRADRRVPHRGAPAAGTRPRPHARPRCRPAARWPARSG